jgi:hypothetical protein
MREFDLVRYWDGFDDALRGAGATERNPRLPLPGRSADTYTPHRVTVRSKPVSRLTSVTCAPGTAAAVGSGNDADERGGGSDLSSGSGRKHEQ